MSGRNKYADRKPHHKVNFEASYQLPQGEGVPWLSDSYVAPAIGMRCVLRRRFFDIPAGAAGTVVRGQQLGGVKVLFDGQAAPRRIDVHLVWFDYTGEQQKREEQANGRHDEPGDV